MVFNDLIVHFGTMMMSINEYINLRSGIIKKYLMFLQVCCVRVHPYGVMVSTLFFMISDFGSNPNEDPGTQTGMYYLK